MVMIVSIAGVCAGSASLSTAPPFRSISNVANDFHDLRPTSIPVAEPEADPGRDLYGNQVLDAVARFKLDNDGSLYEVHSPQTELPRLGSPQG